MQSQRTRFRRRSLPGVILIALTLILVAAGADACSQASAAPEPPSFAGALPGNGSITAGWGAADQHADVTSYVATAKPGGRTCTTIKKTSCAIGGLVNGHTYVIDVQAVSDGGRSTVTSATSTAGVPWFPTAVTTSPGDSSATITWAHPYFAGVGPLTSYSVSSVPGGHQCSTNTLTCTVTGLVNGSTYTFRVVAHNAFGAGPPSANSPDVTPDNTAGGTVGITYLGPVSANQESTTGTILQRDAGISVALPNGRDLWVFGDTSSFSAASGQSNAFIGGSTAAKGRYIPGQTPQALKDIRPAGVQSTSTAPSQFIPTPSDTYMPDGSGRACTPANGAVYTARWPTGAALLDNQGQLFVTYTDVCVTSSTTFTVEGWGFMIYAWRQGKIKVGPYDVFPPSPKGTELPADRAYQSPYVRNGQITLFTSQCASLFVACSSGTVSATTLSDNPLALAVPGAYVAQPAVTDGATQWMPVNVSVAAYPSGLRLIEQTSIGGTFVVFTSATPTGPWHAFYSGTLPGCSTTPKGFCYAFVGHPELGSNSTLVVSYFKPDSPENANVGHVDLASIALPPG
jgi:hypothetical protein